MFWPILSTLQWKICDQASLINNINRHCNFPFAFSLEYSYIFFSRDNRFVIDQYLNHWRTPLLFLVTFRLEGWPPHILRHSLYSSSFQVIRIETENRNRLVNYNQRKATTSCCLQKISTPRLARVTESRAGSLASHTSFATACCTYSQYVPYLHASGLVPACT